MTCKDQNKILDNKIESSVNQYKVDRLNAEISAFSSGDLNKYEFQHIAYFNFIFCNFVLDFIIFFNKKAIISFN